MSLGYALRQRSVHRTQPFPHWEIDRPLTADARQEVLSAFAPDTPWEDSSPAPMQDPDGSLTQWTVNRDNVSRFPALGSTIDDLLSRKTIERIESMASRSMDGAFLNVEIVRDGRTLETSSPTSSAIPLMTMWIAVVTGDASEGLARRVDSSSSDSETVFRDNVGWMFIPLEVAGLSNASRLLNADSRLLVINYMMQATDWKLPPRRNARVA